MFKSKEIKNVYKAIKKYTWWYQQQTALLKSKERNKGQRGNIEGGILLWTTKQRWYVWKWEESNWWKKLYLMQNLQTNLKFSK